MRRVPTKRGAVPVVDPITGKIADVGGDIGHQDLTINTRRSFSKQIRERRREMIEVVGIQDNDFPVGPWRRFGHQCRDSLVERCQIRLPCLACCQSCNHDHKNC